MSYSLTFMIGVKLTGISLKDAPKHAVVLAHGLLALVPERLEGGSCQRPVPGRLLHFEARRSQSL